ncbi:hypothetical protein TIFTF001_017486 [Ficus carica]|uniref:Retrotransposon gag domain-containing protein n=1 Tax=Ficus carica TaxID=3494 RepID=A0AA88A2D0_FICCA|nr:hypothetical protein TIFTF001_017486 [Ficus carica]
MYPDHGHVAPAYWTHSACAPVYPPGALGVDPIRPIRPSIHIGCCAGDFRHQYFGARRRPPAFPAITISPPTLLERPTTIKLWTNEPARTSRALTIPLRPAHRAPGDLSVSEESLGHQQRDEKRCPGRERSRSHNQATRSRVVALLATTRHDSVQYRRDTVNVRGSTTSVFDRLGRARVSRYQVRDYSIDKLTKEEKDDQNRLDHLQRQLDQLMGQRYVLEHVGAADPLFTPTVMATPYPTRFKMSSIAAYDGSTDADEYLENYKAYILIQDANKAVLCKAFCLTLTGVARQWYQRLVPGSIGLFKQLAEAFAPTFLGAKTQKMETSYLFKIKQGIKDRQLVWTLAYDIAPTFAHLKGIARKHAEADEYIRGRGFIPGDQSRVPGKKSNKIEGNQNRPKKGKAASIDVRRAEASPGPRTPTGRFRQYTPLVAIVEHVLNQVSGQGLLQDLPPLWIDHARRNQNKIITPAGAANRTTPTTSYLNRRSSNRVNASEPKHIVHTIFGRTVTGDTASSRRSYFAGECVRAADTVRLSITVGDGPERVTRMVEFIVVDRPSVYNIILGRSTLNALKAVVSTYHLAMKFPTPNVVGVFRGNQEGDRKCYMVAVNKVCRKAPEPAIVMIIFKVDEIDTPDGEIKRLSDLDPGYPRRKFGHTPSKT